jgi:hypothetical protein
MLVSTHPYMYVCMYVCVVVQYPVLSCTSVRSSQGRTLLAVSTNDEGRGRIMLIDPTMPQVVLDRYYGDHPFVCMTSVNGSSTIIAGSTSGALVSLSAQFNSTAIATVGLPPSSVGVRFVAGRTTPTPSTASSKQITVMHTSMDITDFFLVGYSDGTFDIRSTETLTPLYSHLLASSIPFPVTSFAVHAAASSQVLTYVWVMRSTAPLQKADGTPVWRDGPASAALFAIDKRGAVSILFFPFLHALCM